METFFEKTYSVLLKPLFMGVPENREKK